ncbi:MAG TPA: class I SAM-dependent methyltransferase [Rhodospirillales bacterium]|nr:class I SAM-dependent methyltransferase [Rhodospirillales bacterium]
MLLSRLLERMIHTGTLKVIDAAGELYVYTGGPGPEVTVRLHNKALHRKLFFNPCLYIGEAYMDGSLTIEKGTLPGFLKIVASNLKFSKDLPLFSKYRRFSCMFRGLQQYNPISRARSHVVSHYDISNRLYGLFLDQDLQYSCAYYNTPGDNLETAQANKQRHLAAKLLLEPGQRVLDIGSGWGGLALYLAETGGGQVTGLTLSDEQLKAANQRAAETGLSENVHFHLRDYREENGKYDRIVSVGMFEHVGVNYYSEFFAKVRDLLADDGVCVLHSIGRMGGPSSTCAWLRKYIFPGGYSPALSEVLPAVEDSGLWVDDIEVLRLHYAKTLNAWQRRFQANRDKIAELFDERFCRMWEFYLALSESAFLYGDHFVFQMQLSKRRGAVPLTRDYQTEWEHAHSGEAIASAHKKAA